MTRRDKKKRKAPASRIDAFVLSALRLFITPAKAVAGVCQEAWENGSWTLIAQIAILVALGLYIYLPSINGLYLWDDDFLLQTNQTVHDPRGLYYIWTDPEHSLIDFFPLTVSVEWLIWQIWGPTVTDPQFYGMTVYYHTSSLVLHFCNVMLVWYLLRRMGIRMAWFGALIFMVHPILVESVAWMAELKNTIAMPPFILCVLAWIAFDRNRQWEYYVFAFILYLISMLAKTSCVMFPVIILLYAWWKHPETNFIRALLSEIVLSFWLAVEFVKVCIFWNGAKESFRQRVTEASKLTWVFAPTVPFFIIAASDAYFLIIYLRHGVGEQFIPGLLGGPTILGSVIGRTACAGLSLIFYFSKCILPINLMPIYTQWEVNHPAFTLEFLVKFLPWPVMAFGFWWLWRRSAQPWARTATFGFGFFFLNLLPFVGWRPISFMRFGWVMDHFLYVPILGLIGLAAAAASDVYSRIPRTSLAGRAAFYTVLAAVLVVFTIGSHRYDKVFVNRLAYWTYCSSENYVAWPAHNNRGNQLLDDAHTAELNGRPDIAAADYAEAKKEFLVALQLNPVYTEAHNNIGYILSKEGHYKEAEAEFRTALKYTPDFESAQLNLARVLQLESIQLQQQQQQAAPSAQK
jgi:hypothetical protein